MDINDVDKYVKKARKRRILVIIYIVILLFFVMYFVTSPLLMFLLMLFLLFQLFVGFVWSQNFSSIITDECNPQLYYAVVTKLSKNVNIINQALVAELIGDYNSAYAIYENMYQNQKNIKAKLVCLDGMIRTLFMSESYEQCVQKIDEFRSLENEKIRSKNKSRFVRHEFYMAYINGDYQLALERQNAFENAEKKKTNLLFCSTLYYKALIEYRTGNIEDARKIFNEVIEKYPNMAHSIRSREYINSIENGIELSNIQVQRVELPETAKTQKLSKKNIIKLILLLLFILACAFSVVSLNKATSYDTPIKAIEEYDDVAVGTVLTILEPDGNHIVYVYSDEYSVASVAYQSKKDGKYTCEVLDHTGLVVDYFSKMHIKGNSRELHYKFQRDNKNVPAGYEIDELNDDLFIVYQFKETKRYGGNLYALDLQN